MDGRMGFKTKAEDALCAPVAVAVGRLSFRAAWIH
jgi:hypothetical protein